MNYGSSGVSFNIGVPGASITVGSKGVYANMGVPGTGIRNRKKIDAISEKTTDSDNNAPQITEQEFKTYVHFKKTLYIVSAGEEKFLIAGDVDKTCLISKLGVKDNTEAKIAFSVAPTLANGNVTAISVFIFPFARISI